MQAAKVAAAGAVAKASEKAGAAVEKASQKASAVAAEASAVASAAAGAVAAAITPEPLPPPREQWTYGLFDACGCTDPSLCMYGCCCPCLATPKIRAYRRSGKPDAEADDCTILCHIFACYMCGDGLMAHERDEIRGKTNMVRAECDLNCHYNYQCCDDTCSTMCCCGCAAVQMKRELDVYYGNASEGAPVHQGSPAAKKMARP